MAVIAVVILTDGFLDAQESVAQRQSATLEQAVDSALQRGNHHSWALVMMVFLHCKGRGAGSVFFTPAFSSKMSGYSRRLVQCSILLQPWCSASTCSLLGRYSPQSWCIF